PFAQPDAALRAWRTAADMVGGFAPVLSRWRRASMLPTGVGIGVAAGEAIIGNIGSSHHMSYTIIGDAVNTAARLVQMAKAGEVLASSPGYESILGALPARGVASRGDIAVRGDAEATAVHSIQLAGARLRH